MQDYLKKYENLIKRKSNNQQAKTLSALQLLI